MCTAVLGTGGATPHHVEGSPREGRREVARRLQDLHRGIAAEGGSVTWTGRHVDSGGRLRACLGDAEIAELDVLPPGEKDVLRFQIAVEDSLPARTRGGARLRRAQAGGGQHMRVAGSRGARERRPAARP